MFNCKKLLKLQIMPPSLILLITTSQDRLMFPSQSWEVRNSIIIIIIIIIITVIIARYFVPQTGTFLSQNARKMDWFATLVRDFMLPPRCKWHLRSSGILHCVKSQKSADIGQISLTRTVVSDVSQHVIDTRTWIENILNYVQWDVGDVMWKRLLPRYAAY